MRESDVPSAQWAKWAVEAINKIRQQKQRPSLERVCHGVRQNHSYSESTIADRIEQLVDEGLILKVYNKGKCSYKDPGGASRFIVITRDADLTKLVVRSVKEIDDPDGSSIKTIEKYIGQSNCLSVKPGADLTAIVKASLKKAVDRGLLSQEGKAYKATGVDEVGGGRRDKSPKSKGTPRKSKKKELESPKKNALPICSECLGTTKNKNGEPETLSECSACGSSVHPTCLPKHQDIFNCVTARGNLWRCEDCVQCSRCNQTTYNRVCLIKCGSCERSYHMDCMLPAVDKKSTGKGVWRCCYCIDGGPSPNVSPPTPLTPNKDSTSLNTPKSSKSIRVQQLRSLRKAARASLTSKKGQQVVQKVENSSEDGNHPDSSSSSESPHSHSSPIRTSDSNPGGRRLELSEAISKEKQKFFMGSAFFKRYNDKVQQGRVSNDSKTKSAVASQTPTETYNRKTGAITPVTPLTQFPRHVPPLNPSTAGLSKVMPFAAFCTDSDEPWGFAAVKAPLEQPKLPPPEPHPQPAPKKKKDPRPLPPVALSPSSLVKFAVNSKAAEAHQRLLAGVLPVKVATITNLMSMSNDLPPGVTQKDLELMKTAREEAMRRTKETTAVQSDQDILASGSATVSGLPGRCPASIEFGPYHITTWYSSPFPQEYARLGKLFLCEFCLKYTKSKAVLKRHLDKCTWRHPPGTEIYRHKDLSVFEVDGNTAKFYCQNLCLLAKLFLDHKTLYYDVEPFLFYVLTKNDDKGFHLVGYFSKEKHCLQKYNVSCIMTLPHYQRQGFGRFLIDFSYLLSKEEGQPGTPEKPLSDLGRVSYHAYWRSIILEYLHEHRDDTFSAKELSNQTGVAPQDIADMFVIMGMTKLRKRDSEDGEPDVKLSIVVDWSVVDVHAERVAKSKTRIPIEPECLRWTPLVPSIVNPFRVPSQASDAEGELGDDEGEDTKIEIEQEDEDKKPLKRLLSAPEPSSVESPNTATTPVKSRRRSTVKQKEPSPIKETPMRTTQSARARLQSRITDSSDSEAPSPAPVERRSSEVRKQKKPKQRLLTDMFKKNVEKATPVASGRSSSRKSVLSTQKKPEESPAPKSDESPAKKSTDRRTNDKRMSEKKAEKEAPSDNTQTEEDCIDHVEPSLETLGRGSRRSKVQKRQYKEMEEDDIEAVSPPPASEKRKRRKTEPTEKIEVVNTDEPKVDTPLAPAPPTLLRPSRLKLPTQKETPSKPPAAGDSEKVDEPEASHRRLSSRPRREKKLKAEEQTPTKTAEESPTTPASSDRINRRQQAAKERWVKRKMQIKKEEEKSKLKSPDPPKKKETVNSAVREKRETRDRERPSRSSVDSVKAKADPTKEDVQKETAESMEVDEDSVGNASNVESPATDVVTPKKRGWIKGMPRKNYTPKETTKPKGKINRRWGVKPRRKKHTRKVAVEPVQEEKKDNEEVVPETQPADAIAASRAESPASIDATDGPQSSEVDEGVLPESPPKERSDTSSESSSEDEAESNLSSVAEPVKDKVADEKEPAEPLVNGVVEPEASIKTDIVREPSTVEGTQAKENGKKPPKSPDLPSGSDDKAEPQPAPSEAEVPAAPAAAKRSSDTPPPLAQQKAAVREEAAPPSKSPSKEIIDLVADDDDDSGLKSTPVSQQEPDTLETPKKGPGAENAPTLLNVKKPMTDDRSNPPVLERIDSTVTSAPLIDKNVENSQPPQINREPPPEIQTSKERPRAPEPGPPAISPPVVAPQVKVPEKTPVREPEPLKTEQRSAFEPPVLIPLVEPPKPIQEIHKRLDDMPPVLEQNRPFEPPVDPTRNLQDRKNYDPSPCKKLKTTNELDARENYHQLQEMMRKSYYEQHQEAMKKAYESQVMEHQKKGFDHVSFMDPQKRAFEVINSQDPHKKRQEHPGSIPEQKTFEPVSVPLPATTMADHPRKAYEPALQPEPKKGFEPVDHQKKPPQQMLTSMPDPKMLPMEVDLTHTDDSRSPAPPPLKPQVMATPHTPPPPVLESHHHQRKEEEKKIINPPIRSAYPEPKLHQDRYNTAITAPMKEKKERKSHSSGSNVVNDDSKSHRHDEILQQSKQTSLFQSKQAEVGGYPGESPHPLTHSFPCSDLDLANDSAGSAMMAAQAAAAAEQQRQLQFSDCAQQGLAVLHHLSQHTPPPHMHLGYQTQQNRSSKQSVNSRSSRVQTQNRQTHQSPAHYHQSNYMMPQGYVSMLGHRMQHAAVVSQAQQARLGPSPGSCSVSSANFYLGNVAPGGSPSGPPAGPPPPHSSLAKLQQLTNGLEGTPVMGGGTPPPTPPSHSTPPPANNHYHKFYQPQRHPNLQPGSGHNMLPYQTFANGGPSYPQSAGRSSGPTYPGAGFINQGAPPSLQMQMMQPPQYPGAQDPSQQNMYPPYSGSIHNTYLMQPLNSPMRR